MILHKLILPILHQAIKQMQQQVQIKQLKLRIVQHLIQLMQLPPPIKPQI